MSTVTTMSVTRALAKLKLLDKQIASEMGKFSFLALVAGQNKVPGYASNDAFADYVKSKYASAMQLIANRAAIKAAIVQSNAGLSTESLAGLELRKVAIGDRKMTVAEAIEYKTAVKYDKMLLLKMQTEFVRANDALIQAENGFKAARERFQQQYIGRDGTVVPSEFQPLCDRFDRENTPKLVGMTGLKDEIDSLSDRIQEFEAEVDFVLSEANTRTDVTVELL